MKPKVSYPKRSIKLTNLKLDGLRKKQRKLKLQISEIKMRTLLLILQK